MATKDTTKGKDERCVAYSRGRAKCSRGLTRSNPSGVWTFVLHSIAVFSVDMNSVGGEAGQSKGRHRRIAACLVLFFSANDERQQDLPAAHLSARPRSLHSHVDVVRSQARGTNLLAYAVPADGEVVRAVLGATEPCLAYKQGGLFPSRHVGDSHINETVNTAVVRCGAFAIISGEVGS